jgi:hypothetical protein
MALSKKLFKAAAAGVTNTDNFDIVTYTATGATQSITSLDFQPDFVWIKDRGTSESHQLFDSIRGAGKVIESDDTTGEVTRSDGFTSFDSNGFTLGADSAGFVNYTGRGPYVAWCWKADGTAVSNTNGTITSQVSANTDAGFSICTYTGNGTAGSTFGHGLNSAPELAIVKRRSGVGNWVVHPKLLGDNNFLLLEATDATINNTNYVRSTNTTTVTIGAATAVNATNETYVAYNFHSVDGYQRMGTYTGASGLRVYTTDDGTSTGNGGFQPRFLMVKRTSGSTNWVILDSLRVNGIYESVLYPNTTDAEPAGNYDEVTFNSDGFTWNQTENPKNAVGSEYIYLAIA